MSGLKAWNGSGWTLTSAKGKAWLGGVEHEFGYGGGSTEVIDWTALPALTDASDGTDSYHMGCAFSVVAGKPCVGLRWRVPDSLVAPGSGYHATLYSLSPTVEIRNQVIVPVPGGNQDFIWTGGPADLVPGVEYVCGVTTVHYTFRSAASAGDFPFESPSGNVIAQIGRLTSPANPTAPPASNFPSIYYVSPIVGV